MIVVKIVVINGTEKRGVTYALKEKFLSSLSCDADITEFYLPKDCPNFCVGCTNCFTQGEHVCKDREYIGVIEQAILQADLLVFTSPAYVMHATGAMKAFLDHLAYRWMPHRSAKEMFGKRAVIITQCLGAGGKTAAQDIWHSVSWWGVSYIKVFTVALMGDIVWDNLAPEKRAKIERKMCRLAWKISNINFVKPARTCVACKFKFMICRLIIKSVYRKHPDSIDGRYWERNGWLGKSRPWKR